jgi:hypothetical protein
MKGPAKAGLFLNTLFLCFIDHSDCEWTLLGRKLIWGFTPIPSYFLLLNQKKVTQEKVATKSNLAFAGTHKPGRSGLAQAQFAHFVDSHPQAKNYLIINIRLVEWLEIGFYWISPQTPSPFLLGIQKK